MSSAVNDPVMSFAEDRPARRFLQEVAGRAVSRRAPRRRTRIVATLGPATDSEKVLLALGEAGMDVARIPLAHGSLEDALLRMAQVRKLLPHVGVLADLPGPKVRCSPFPDEGVTLEPGALIRIAPSALARTSSETAIGVAVEEVVASLEPDDIVSLGDGGVSLVVANRVDDTVLATVRSGGHLLGRPGFTAPSARYKPVVPTPEDLTRLDAFVEAGVDLVAVSFVRDADDIVNIRDAMKTAGAMLVAKIETGDAIANLDRIVGVADAVMVARGDLGVRLPLEDIPHHQKHIIRTGVRFGRPVITATQMLESMIHAPVPTRAEVTDVANAVLDGTSAVMLSGETAVGIDPVNVVATMARIVERAERDFDYLHWGDELGVLQSLGDPSSPRRITAAITGAAWRAALEQDAVAIVACSRSGATARAISRYRPHIPILAITQFEQTARQLAVSWGVEAVVIPEENSTDKLVEQSVKAAVEHGFAEPGDVVVVLAGSPNVPEPIADTVRLVRVPEAS